MKLRRATHLVAGFEHEADARRILDDLRKKLARFYLELQCADRLSLHRSASRLDPEKTQLIPFGRYAKAGRPDTGPAGLGTFDFLGYTHICAKSLDGKFRLKRQTMRKRMRAKLAAIKEELRQRPHQRVAEQGQWLNRVVAGYVACHDAPINTGSVSTFRS